MTKSVKIISWVSAIVAALIMLQTLYFKFTAAPESVYIFTTLGMEPYGRIGIGIGELVAALLLLLPRTRIFGAGLGAGLMSGAVFFHLTKLGIDVQNDGGYLFLLCLIVLIACFICLILERNKIRSIIRHVFSSR